jgi:hypothetical protein
MERILLLAFVVSPAYADVYKCNIGSKTVYQDAPCANAKSIDNFNGQAPSREEQYKAMARAQRDRAALAAQRSPNVSGKITITQEIAPQTPAAPMSSNRRSTYTHR